MISGLGSYSSKPSADSGGRFSATEKKTSAKGPGGSHHPIAHRSHPWRWAISAPFSAPALPALIEGDWFTALTPGLMAPDVLSQTWRSICWVVKAEGCLFNWMLSLLHDFILVKNGQTYVEHLDDLGDDDNAFPAASLVCWLQDGF